MMTMWRPLTAVTCSAILTLAACGEDDTSPAGPGDGSSSSSSSSSSSGSTGDGGGGGSSDGGAAEGGSSGSLASPRTAADVEALITSGAYKAWKAEPAVHASRSPSPHGANRIYASPEIVANANGTAPWPENAAAVKELYASADAEAPMGWAYYVKTQPDSAAGAGWYWYERIGNQVVADGLGTSGTAKDVCAGCHARAGTNPANTPSPGARDFVFTPVP